MNTLCVFFFFSFFLSFFFSFLFLALSLTHSSSRSFVQRHKGTTETTLPYSSHPCSYRVFFHACTQICSHASRPFRPHPLVPARQKKRSPWSLESKSKDNRLEDYNEARVGRGHAVEQKTNNNSTGIQHSLLQCWKV